MLTSFTAYKYTPTLEAYLKTPSGEPGWLCTFYNHDENGNPVGDGVQDHVLQDTRVKLNDFLPSGLTPTWTIKLRGSLTMDKTGEYQLGLTVAGRAKLFVNDKLTIDNWTKQRPGDFFYGYGCIFLLTLVYVLNGDSRGPGKVPWKSSAPYP